MRTYILKDKETKFIIGSIELFPDEVKTLEKNFILLPQ